MKGERGYTLVEMLIAIAITGFLVTALGLVTQQVFVVPERGNDQVMALHAVQNAAHWVSLDGQTAKSASGGSGLTLTLPDDSLISYTLSGDELHRISGGTDRTIARNISGASFTVDGRVINMNIIAAPDSRFGVSENHSYQVFMRPTG
jgi:prepilin-type N-terminal cleavage/methylation domain-containing protein